MKSLIFKLLVVVFALSACRSDYEKLVAKETASGTRHDSLWLNMYLGQPQKMWFDSCRALNLRGILDHGTELPMTTRWDVSADFPQPVYLNFYPSFDDNKVTGMRCIFLYQNWTPLVNKFSQDSLLVETRRYLEKRLPGNAFLDMSRPDKGKVWVKVDGNRQVILTPFEECKVLALIADLSFGKK